MILKTNHEIAESIFSLRKELLKDLSTEENRQTLHLINKLIYEDYPVCQIFYDKLINKRE